MTAPALPVTPAGEVVGWFEAGSAAWHNARANGIGGSEISAVLGLSPFESAFSLWHRKRGEIDPVAESREMYWGKKHEPAICDEYAIVHPDQVVMPSPTFTGTGRPWQIANPDRLIITADGELELLEAKTSRDADGWGEEHTDQIPVYYRAQCLWYLDTLALRRCRVAVLISGSDWRQYVIEYDQAEAAMMRDHGEQFIRTVRDGIRPDIDGHNATYQALKQLPEGQQDYDVAVTPELRDRYFGALDAVKAAEWEKTEAAGLLLDAIGDGRRAICGPQKVATRTVRGGKTYSLQPARNRSAA